MTLTATSWIVGVIGVTLSQTGWAQTAAEKKAEVPPVSPAYEDRLIDTGDLPALTDDSAEFSYNPNGQPRSWRIEGFGSNIKSGGLTRHENGFNFGGRYDTTDYGALSLDGTFRKGSNASNFTVWQRGLAFDDDWRANNGAGMLNTPAIELARNQYRFYLPTFPVAGVETEWLHDGNLQIQASAGAPGTFNGLRLAGFSRLGGNLFTGGAQWVVAPDWLAGFQLADVQGVGVSLDPAAPDVKTSGRSWYGSVAWQDTSSRVQVNLLDSEIGQGAHRRGIWFDGETRDGRYRHNYGLFRLDPHVVWGYMPFIEDTVGGYYRVNYQSQQWLWTAGVDSVNSVSGHGIDGIYGTASVRYQVNRLLGVGGGATVRHAHDEAEAAYTFVDMQSSLGTTRVQLDAASATGAQKSRQITVDQAWPTATGLRLSTTLSLSRETAVEKRTTRANLGFNGGVDLSNSLSLEGNVHWLANRESSTTRGTYANVNLNWRISSRWSVSMTYYDNRREDPPILSVASLIPTQLFAPVVRDRALFLIVRYEDRAGTPVAPLGGSPGSGAGNIVGYLYFDGNDNQKRDANETGAANVTILLDGRFSTRTDHQGRFEFPLVAAGTHAISVIPDNLPLPYFVGGDDKRQVIVRTRETTTLDIPASQRK